MKCAAFITWGPTPTSVDPISCRRKRGDCPSCKVRRRGSANVSVECAIRLRLSVTVVSCGGVGGQQFYG